MPDYVESLLTAASWRELALIFFVKIAEVSMGTLRHLLVNRGYRRPGAFLSFFEVVLWVFVASRVINGIADAPLKGIVYSLAYAVGVYVGSKLESRLAFGDIMVQTITLRNRAPEITNALRERGFGVTSLKAEGKDSDRSVLLALVTRRRRDEVIQCVLDIDPRAMISTSSATHLYGGYVPSWRGLVK